MPGLSNRLERVIASLSAKERAILVLKAISEGVEPDPQLRLMSDPVEGRLFNRYMGLIYVANVELDAASHCLFYHTERLEESMVLDLLREAAVLIQEQEGEAVDPKVVRRWRHAKDLSAPLFFFGVAEDLRQQMLVDVLDPLR